LQAVIVEVILCPETFAWKERVAYDGVGRISVIHFEALNFYFFEA
jgi:hypothetical protein